MNFVDNYIFIRNKIIHFFYTKLIKPILFLIDPEAVHNGFIQIGRFLGHFRATRGLTRAVFGYRNSKLEQTVAGIHFPNPIGLAAGFDKDAQLTKIIPAVGFGFMEIGSVTGRPCNGNKRPRLWRLPKSRALIIYYGLKNAGASFIAQKLSQKTFPIPLGVNIAKTNNEQTVNTEAGIADYLVAYREFASCNVGAYYTINISCPNAFGGQPFTEPERLALLLEALDKETRPKPIFLKLSPDLAPEILDQIIALAEKYHLAGFICANLTKDYDLQTAAGKIAEPLPAKVGGLSGKIVEDLANEQIRYIYEKTKRPAGAGIPAPAGHRFVIIGCGGIFTAEDAYRKIKAGASLVQMITGMIFEGPQTISEINRGLIQLLKRDNLQNIQQAVGMDNL